MKRKTAKEILVESFLEPAGIFENSVPDPLKHILIKNGEDGNE